MISFVKLSEATKFLKETYEYGFLKVARVRKKSEEDDGQDNFVASRDWWALVEDDIGMAPGSYIINQEIGIPPEIIRHWKFISDNNKSAKILKRISKNIKNAFHPELYLEADFGRRGPDIVMIRKTRRSNGRDFEYNKNPLYHIILPGTKIVEAVDSRTFDFFYRKLSQHAGEFFMQKSLEHQPIILYDKKSPYALIMPISEEYNYNNACSPGKGYFYVFDESDTY